MNLTKNILRCFLPIFLFSIQAFSQTADSTNQSASLDQRKSGFRISPDSVKTPSEITMPMFRMSTKEKKFDFSVHASPQRGVTTWRKSDTQHLNPQNYRMFKIEKKKSKINLDNGHYILPTRQEYEVLKVLWARDGMLDTSIYASVDSSTNTSMMLLNKILENMARKGLVSREMVSARFEFNAFGVPIEMSELNRKNRIFAYRSLVDKTRLKYFINAKHYEVTQDSSVLKKENLKAVRNDSTLLNDLNSKVLSP